MSQVAPSYGTDLNAGPGYGAQSYNVSPNVLPLTNKQLAAVGYAGGFTNSTDLAEWIHVVHAESGGSPGALGIGGAPGGVGTDSEYSVGLSMINVAASPDLAPGLLEPTTNALAAHKLFTARGWEPWAPTDFAAPPSQADETAAAEVTAMSPTAVDTLANQADREANSGITYVPPPYPGTNKYPQALQGSFWPGSKITGSAADQAFRILTLGTQNVPGGLAAGTTLPSAPPASPGVATNTNLGGFGALLQQLDAWLNIKPSSTGVLNLSSVELFGVRLLVALPGLLALLMAAAAGLLGALGKNGATQVLQVVPGGPVLAKAAKVR